MEDGRGIFFGAQILYFLLCSTLSPHIKINRMNAFDQKYEKGLIKNNRFSVRLFEITIREECTLNKFLLLMDIGII